LRLKAKSTNVALPRKLAEFQIYWKVLDKEL